MLPSGDPALIEQAVAGLLDAMHPWTDGGYIFAPAHNLQVDVSPESVSVMDNAAIRDLSARAGSALAPIPFT